VVVQVVRHAAMTVAAQTGVTEIATAGRFSGDR